MVKKRKIKAFDVFLCILMLFVILTTLYPFWYTIVVSLSGVDKSSGIQFLPNEFTLDAYKLLMDYDPIWTGYRNTIIRCILGTFLSVFFTALTAYPLSKKELPFNNAFTNFILFTMLFSGGMIPSYLLVKNLHLLNTIWALVLPNLMGAYNIFIVRNFFRSIPVSLEEAARIDGAGWFFIWGKIVVPLAKPVLATVTLWTLVGHWNAWFDATIYITDPNKTVMQVILRRISIENSAADMGAIVAKMQRGADAVTSRSLEMAMVVVTILPMLIVYPFLQKYFVKGIMVGSVKG
jgi:putative aldouronate transport system permease protein